MIKTTIKTSVPPHRHRETATSLKDVTKGARSPPPPVSSPPTPYRVQGSLAYLSPSHHVNQTDTRAVNTIHAPLRDRFPVVFPQDYDAIHPWKLGIPTNMIEQMPDFDLGLLRWALTNPHPPDLDNQPADTVAPAERAEAAQLLVASIQRGQDTVARVRVHREREEQRRPQRECEQHHRETNSTLSDLSI